MVHKFEPQPFTAHIVLYMYKVALSFGLLHIRTVKQPTEKDSMTRKANPPSLK